MSETSWEESRLYTCASASDIRWNELIPRAAIGIIIGTILQAASVTYGMMIFARIFNGVFNGMLTSTVPTYQSECSRPERRGPDVMISATVNIL